MHLMPVWPMARTRCLHRGATCQYDGLPTILSKILWLHLWAWEAYGDTREVWSGTVLARQSAARDACIPPCRRKCVGQGFARGCVWGNAYDISPLRDIPRLDNSGYPGCRVVEVCSGLKKHTCTAPPGGSRGCAPGGGWRWTGPPGWGREDRQGRREGNAPRKSFIVGTLERAALGPVGGSSADGCQQRGRGEPPALRLCCVAPQVVWIQGVSKAVGLKRFPHLGNGVSRVTPSR